MKTIEQKLEQRREWQKAARERAIARQREKLADPAWRESQYQKMRDSIDRRIAKHADGVVGGKKEFTLLNKSEMELLADAYEMANIMH